MNVVKKLENAELPEIELKKHRENLKSFLLNKYYPSKKSFLPLLIFFLIIAAALFLIIWFFF